MPIWQAMKGDSHFSNVFVVAEPARGKGAPRQRVSPPQTVTPPQLKGSWPGSDEGLGI